MQTLGTKDLAVDLKVKLVSKGDKPYEMDATVWRIGTTLIAFKQVRRRIFVYLSPEQIQNKEVVITARA